jgi:hypothetical protein
MIRGNSAVIVCLLMASTAGFTAGQFLPTAPSAPKGVYALLHLDGAVSLAQTAAYIGPPPPYPNPAADTVLVAYLTTFLNNPAVSGLAVEIPWDFINPNDPGPDAFRPAADAYLWNWFDDVFIAVDQWNRTHHDLAPKTIQLLPDAGFNSPGWVFSKIDASVCGSNQDCTGSCDGLFMKAPAPPVSAKCGYTTLFFKTESTPAEQIPLPLPWNSVYKSIWQTFLIALNQRIQQEPSSSAFVSISMAGPTSSSTEMILPDIANQKPYTCGGGNGNLSLTEALTGPADNLSPVCPLTNPPFDVPTAWNTLFQNYYGTDPKYENTDLPFIEEWDAAIDEYGRIFSGAVLILTTSTDNLPTFPDAASSLLSPAPGFTEDCGNDPNTNPAPNQGDAMACAAVTQVLAYFTNPIVGGNNAKGTQENGMSAGRDGIDLGTNGIKWLAKTTSAGWTPLPGTPYPMSRILGGLQFAKALAGATLQGEGCPGYLTALCTGSDGTTATFTPAEGLQNVMGISFFPGTAVAPFFCAYTAPYGCGSSSVDDGGNGNFDYSNAPMNYLQAYDKDIIYAAGLSQCSTLQITGRPASPGVTPMLPNVSTCAPQSPPDAPAMQQEFNLASQKLLSIAEPASTPGLIFPFNRLP